LVKGTKGGEPRLLMACNKEVTQELARKHTYGNQLVKGCLESNSLMP